MPDKILDLIQKTITFIPGVVGLASIDFNMSNNALKESAWSKAFLVDKTNEGLSLSMAVIVSKDIQAKIIAKEIESAVISIMKKEKINLLKLDIFVRGVNNG